MIEAIATVTLLLQVFAAARAFMLWHARPSQPAWLLVFAVALIAVCLRTILLLEEPQSASVLLRDLLILVASACGAGAVVFIGKSVTETRPGTDPPGGLAGQAGVHPFHLTDAPAFEGLLVSEHDLIVDGNQQLAEMLGYSLKEVLGRPIREFLTGEIREIDAGDTRVSSDPAYEHRALRKNGSFFPVEVRTRTVVSENRNLRLTALRDMTGRKKTEERLRESEESYRELTESITDVFFAMDTDLTITHWNKASEYVTGVSTRDAVGRSFFDLFPELESTRVEEVFRQVLRSRSPQSLVTEYELAGVPAVVEIRAYPARRGVSVFLEDITDRIRAEERLRASLREKEALLKEIHHRVKNNLQIISSLLSLQSDAMVSDSALDALRDSQGRVRSMAMIHEQLYSSGDLARIDFGQYISDLSAQLFRTYGTQSRAITLHLDLEPITLQIDRAIPCGMIVNELITNCLKHAFRGREEGHVWIALKREEVQDVRMSVRDDGVGGAHLIDLENAPSLGLRLIRTLAEQLKGQVSVEGTGGTLFTIRFPLS